MDITWGKCVGSRAVEREPYGSWRPEWGRNGGLLREYPTASAWLPDWAEQLQQPSWALTCGELHCLRWQLDMDAKYHVLH